MNDSDINQNIFLSILNNNDLLSKIALYSNIDPLILKNFLQKQLNKYDDKNNNEICNDNSYNDNSDKATIYIDGGARGNPGHAGIGIVIEDNNGKNGYYHYIGIATNNEAEYKALIRSLYIATTKNYKNITVFTDSEFVTKQINGKYKVKSENIIELYYNAKNLISKFSKFEILHILREKNVEADRLVNLAIDKKNREEINIKLY